MTRPARTLLDLAAVAPGAAEPALDDALVRELVTVRSVAVLLDRVGNHGRAGTALLRQLLDRRLEGQAPTESALEDAIVGVLRAYGLPEPQRQYPVALPGGAVLRLDLAYPRAGLGIEGDGRIWHSSRQDFLRDRARTNRLAACGWRLLRFGWADARERSGDVAATVAGVLRAEGA